MVWARVWRIGSRRPAGTTPLPPGKAALHAMTALAMVHLVGGRDDASQIPLPRCSDPPADRAGRPASRGLRRRIWLSAASNGDPPLPPRSRGKPGSDVRRAGAL